MFRRLLLHPLGQHQYPNRWHHRRHLSWGAFLHGRLGGALAVRQRNLHEPHWGVGVPRVSWRPLLCERRQRTCFLSSRVLLPRGNQSGSAALSYRNVWKHNWACSGQRVHTLHRYVNYLSITLGKICWFGNWILSIFSIFYCFCYIKAK